MLQIIHCSTSTERAEVLVLTEVLLNVACKLALDHPCMLLMQSYVGLRNCISCMQAGKGPPLHAVQRRSNTNTGMARCQLLLDLAHILCKMTILYMHVLLFSVHCCHVCKVLANMNVPSSINACTLLCLSSMVPGPHMKLTSPCHMHQLLQLHASWQGAMAPRVWPLWSDVRCKCSGHLCMLCTDVASQTPERSTSWQLQLDITHIPCL